MISRRDLFKLGAKAALAATLTPVLAKVSMAGEPADVRLAMLLDRRLAQTEAELLAKWQGANGLMAQVFSEGTQPDNGEGLFALIHGST